ncbi:hypothetical protein [Nitrosospira sp. Is2]|nr:hypothetical protein [Nitrosospira sp. Is2]WON73458.1 hypothetical protein R5L00_13395 [Nitrosospira sp. Is2]
MSDSQACGLASLKRTQSYAANLHASSVASLALDPGVRALRCGDIGIHS